MSARSALEELRRLSTIAEEYMARVAAVRGQAQSYAQHYRVMAELLRKQAARSRFPEIRERLLRAAAFNERLCAIAERSGRSTEKPPRIKSRTNLRIEESHNRERLLPDRFALSAMTTYLDTAAVINETHDAIESSLRRLGLRSYLAFEMAPGPPLPSLSPSEVRTESEFGTIVGEPRKDAVRNTPHEDPVAQARRHVREAEFRVARQEALVERLSHDRKLTALADQAREILETLRQTRDLARDHLALELRK